ncbi:MAG: glycosyltransferase [Desulfobulbaceae bacterium]|nr:glycosyltransferase [Desulfobulbaceae bacterium]
MRVSIVTISYNQDEFLERAINSVLEQDYDDIEYIIVDPGSTDRSREIIERYRSEIAKVIFEPDEGPAGGLNKGFAHATGDIFGCVNADDVYLPGSVRKAVQVFQSCSSLDVVHGWGYIIDEKDNIIKIFRSTLFNLWRFTYGGAWIMQPSTFFRRQAFLDVGGFNKENRTNWDGELLLDFGLSGKKFKLIRDYWSVFTIHDSSISGSQRFQKEEQRNKIRMFKKVVGREPRRIDVMFRLAARLQKWLLDPVGFILNIKYRMKCYFFKRIWI